MSNKRKNYRRYVKRIEDLEYKLEMAKIGKASMEKVIARLREINLQTKDALFFNGMVLESIAGEKLLRIPNEIAAKKAYEAFYTETKNNMKEKCFFQPWENADEYTKKFWFNFVTLFYKETEH